MIKATLAEVRDAFRAFQGRPTATGSEGGIGNAVLPPKAAYRVARLIQKLKSEVRAFEEAQRKLILDAGGKNTGGGVELSLEPRRDDESQSEFSVRESEHAKKVADLNERVEELLAEEIEIDYDPIPLSLFDNERDATKSAALRPNDIAAAGPFIKE